MISDICQQCGISEIVEFQLEGLLLCKECYKDMLSNEDWVRLKQEEWKRENYIMNPGVSKLIDYIESKVGQKLLGQTMWLELILILREELKLAVEEGVFEE